jgi:hypothetical protein
MALGHVARLVMANDQKFIAIDAGGCKMKIPSSDGPLSII